MNAANNYYPPLLSRDGNKASRKSILDESGMMITKAIKVDLLEEEEVIYLLKAQHWSILKAQWVTKFHWFKQVYEVEWDLL